MNKGETIIEAYNRITYSKDTPTVIAKSRVFSASYTIEWDAPKEPDLKFEIRSSGLWFPKKE